MKCGKCHSEGVDIIHVRACYRQDTRQIDPEDLEGPMATTTTDVVWNRPRTSQAASEKQVAFLKDLLEGRDHGFDEGTMRLQLEITTQSRKDTSRLIERLLEMPRKPKTSTNPAGELLDGIYRKDGVLYRVYHTVHGANQQVASVINLDVDKDASAKDKFTYVGKAIVRTFTADDMLPFDEAVKIASAYEWCIACGTILHNDKSVELGIGPVCRGKFRHV
jgi:hypothetical protein